MREATVLVVALVLLAAVPGRTEARVVRFVVEQTRPFAAGKTFGDVGPFERLEGTIDMEVDPRDPLNAGITNLDKAPRNSKGLVEFSSRFIIVKPVDMRRGNQKLLYGVNNRGTSIELMHQAFPLLAVGALPESGDMLIFRLGYTYVDAGWAGDITSTATRLGANLPVAVQPDGHPIVAPIRIAYTGIPGGDPMLVRGAGTGVGTATGYTLPLKGNSQFRSYEAADTDTTHSTLTVRDAIRGAKRSIPADRWAFGRCPTGQASLVPTTTDICLFEKFQADRIYELIYPAQNPWVMGLGYAVTRDVASFLRYALKDDASHANPLARDATTAGVRRAYGLGTSSTGMYLREFLYLGFNEDEAHRKVFDAVRIAIPGTHRLFANVEFADPNVYSLQNQNSDFLSYSYPPLTYAVTTDPISRIHDGILKRPATDPLVFQVDSGNEFWQMNASLNVHDGRGRPVPVPDNVRLYFLSSHSHVGASGVAAVPGQDSDGLLGICEYATNGNRSYNTVLRALLIVLDEWADSGIAPPTSQYPDVRNATLVTQEVAAKSFPAIPGVRFPTVLNELSTAFRNYGDVFL